MKTPQRGEVWLVDLGMAAKVRPAVVTSIPATDGDRVLVTTSARGSRFDAAVSVPSCERAFSTYDRSVGKCELILELSAPVDNA